MIEISELSFAFKDYQEGNYKPIFENLNLKVAKGQKLLILGVPDSGKSTLARIISALIPRHVEGEISGSIKVNSLDILKIEAWELTDKLTLVTQNPQEQLLMTSLVDEIAFPLESLGFNQKEIEKRVVSSLKRWNLEEMGEVNPQETSGGERKRLLLATTEAIDADVWIMDEPFDDLDYKYKNLLAKRIKESDKTVVVFASRYIGEYKGVFDSFGLIKDKHIVVDQKDEILKLYEQESERSFVTTDVKLQKLHSKTLRVKDLKIVHQRFSVKADNPFTLNTKDFYVESGEVVALVGPNGSGKSTFSRVLCGLDPYLDGSISIDGKVATSKELNRNVAYLFQNPDFGIFLPTVEDELSWSMRHDKQKAKKVANEVASLFHLDLKDNPTMMSYGSRKHLQAAVYYILERPFVIIDELDSGVTYAAAYEIISLLRLRGAAIVIITHDQEFAKSLATRQYVIENKEVIEKGEYGDN